MLLKVFKNIVSYKWDFIYCGIKDFFDYFYYDIILECYFYVFYRLNFIHI